eukprot:TRINITY_DN10532_c0_g1_i1.p1 TRINITY_DN10532_c0_g1~~TRINITY_DN10532_c0_g1_i1.p1  ORF type:complete len:1241 (-),score=215.36 TRINITY_DN10532_c0_g1_i1:336-4058(-)
MQNRMSDRTDSGPAAFDASADISSINDSRFNGQRVDTFKTPGRLLPKSFQTPFSGISGRKDKSLGRKDNSFFIGGLAVSQQAPPESRKSESVLIDTGHEEMTRRILNEQWQQFAEKQHALHEQMQRRIVGTIRDDLKHVLAHFQNALQADVQNGMDRCSTTVLETRELQSQFREAIQELQQSNSFTPRTTENISQTGQAQVSCHCERLGSIVKDMMGVQQSLAATARSLSLEAIMPDILLQIRGAATEIESRLEEFLHSNISQIQKQIAEQQIPTTLVDDIEHIKGVVSENTTTSEHVRSLDHVAEAITEIKDEIRNSLKATDASMNKHEIQKYVLHLSTRAIQTSVNQSMHVEDAQVLAQARAAITGDISAAVMPAIQEIKDEIDRRFSTQHAVLESIEARVAPFEDFSLNNINHMRRTEDDPLQPLLDSADHIKHKLEELSMHQPHEQVQELLTNVHRITTLLDEQSPAWQQHLEFHQVLQSDVGYIKQQAEQHFQHTVFDQLRSLPQSLWERYRSDQNLSDELQSFRRRELEALKGRMESAETCIVNDLREQFASLHEVSLTRVDLRNEVDLLVHEIRAATTPVLCDTKPQAAEAVARHSHQEPEGFWSMKCFRSEVALIAFVLGELVIQVLGAYLELGDGPDQSRFFAAWAAINLPWVLNAISCFAFLHFEWQTISSWADENFFYSRLIWVLAVLRPSFLHVFSYHVSDLQGPRSSIDRRALDKAVERETAELREECDELKRAILEQQDGDAVSDVAAPERPQRRIEQEAEHQMAPPSPFRPGAPSHDPVSLHLPSNRQGAASASAAPLGQQVQIQAAAVPGAGHSCAGAQARRDGDTTQRPGQPQLPGASVAPLGSSQHFQGVIPMNNVGSVSHPQQGVAGMQSVVADQADGPHELGNWQAILVNRALDDDVRHCSEPGGQLPACFLCGMAPQAMDSKAVRQYRMLMHGSALAALFYSDLPKIMVAAWLLGVLRFDCSYARAPSNAAATCAHILVLLGSSLDIVYVLTHLLVDFLPQAASYCQPGSLGLHFLQLTEGAFEPQLEASDRSIAVQFNVEEKAQPIAPDEFFCDLKSVRGDSTIHMIQRIAVPALTGNPRCVFDGLPASTDFVVSLAPAREGILLCCPKEFQISTGRSAEPRPDLELSVADVGPTWAILAWKNVDLEANLRVSISSPAGNTVRTELTQGTCHTLHGLESSTSYFIEAGFFDLRPGEQTCTVQFETQPSGAPAASDLQD